MPDHHGSPIVCVQPLISVVLCMWMVLTNFTSIYCLMSSSPDVPSNETVQVDIIFHHFCPDEYFRSDAKLKQASGSVCRLCRKCSQREVTLSDCTNTSDRVCDCKTGYRYDQKQNCVRVDGTQKNGTKGPSRSSTRVPSPVTGVIPTTVSAVTRLQSSVVPEKSPKDYDSSNHKPSSAGKPDWTDFYILTVSSTAVLFFTLSLVLLFLMAVMKARSWYLYRRIPGSGMSLRLQGWLSRLPTFPFRSRSQVSEHHTSISPISIVMETEVTMEGGGNRSVRSPYRNTPKRHPKPGHPNKYDKASITQFSTTSTFSDSTSHEDAASIAYYLKNLYLEVCCAKMELALPKASCTIYITSHEDILNTHNVVSQGLILSEVNIVLGNSDWYCDSNKNRLTLQACQDCQPDQFECAELSIPDLNPSNNVTESLGEAEAGRAPHDVRNVQHKVAPDLALDSSEIGSLLETRHAPKESTKGHQLDFLDVSKLYSSIIASLKERQEEDNHELRFKSTIVVNLKTRHGKPVLGSKYHRVKRREGRCPLPQALERDEGKKYRCHSPFAMESPEHFSDTEYDETIKLNCARSTNVQEAECEHGIQFEDTFTETECAECLGVEGRIQSLDEWGMVVHPLKTNACSDHRHEEQDESLHPLFACSCNRTFVYFGEGVFPPWEKIDSVPGIGGNRQCLHCRLYDPHRIHHIPDDTDSFKSDWASPSQSPLRIAQQSLSQRFDRGEEGHFFPGNVSHMCGRSIGGEGQATDLSSPVEVYCSDPGSDALSLCNIPMDLHGMRDHGEELEECEEGIPLIEGACKGEESRTGIPEVDGSYKEEEFGRGSLRVWSSSSSIEKGGRCKYSQTKV